MTHSAIDTSSHPLTSPPRHSHLYHVLTPPPQAVNVYSHTQQPIPWGLPVAPIPKARLPRLRDLLLLPRLWHPGNTVPWEGDTRCICLGKAAWPVGQSSQEPLDPQGLCVCSAPSPFRESWAQACGHALPPNLILHWPPSSLASQGLEGAPQGPLPPPPACPTAFRPLCELHPLQSTHSVRAGGLAMPLSPFPVIQQRGNSSPAHPRARPITWTSGPHIR